MTQGRIYLGMPGYGRQTADAGCSFWRACRDMSNVINDYRQGSLLATNFNNLWCNALNRANAGENIARFAMQHDDIGAGEYWLDTAIEELERHDLDILGVVVPLKDGRGLSSIALHNGPIENRAGKFSEWLTSCGIKGSTLTADHRSRLLEAFSVWLNRTDANNWRPFCRLSMHDVYELPETFTSEDVGKPILLNTGLWVCRFDMKWATKVHFEINNRIVFDPKLNRYHEQTEPEDWFFSRLCHELGLKIGATRKIQVKHRGEAEFFNTSPWGYPHDKEYTDKSPVPGAFPHEVTGWLRREEGKALSELARGKRVLEIGSYCGKSTICLAQTARMVECIDTWDGRGTPQPRETFREFLDNCERYGVSDRVHPISEGGQVSSPDIVFIDGSHDLESVRQDIEFAMRILSPNGLIAFHDYRMFPGEGDGQWDPGVTEAVNEFVDSGAEIISRHATLAVVRPPAQILSEV